MPGLSPRAPGRGRSQQGVVPVRRDEPVQLVPRERGRAGLQSVPRGEGGLVRAAQRLMLSAPPLHPPTLPGDIMYIRYCFSHTLMLFHSSSHLLTETQRSRIRNRANRVVVFTSISNIPLRSVRIVINYIRKRVNLCKKTLTLIFCIL